MTEGVKCDICGRFYSDQDDINYPQAMIGSEELDTLDQICGLCFKRIMELREQLRQEYILELTNSLKKNPVPEAIPECPKQPNNEEPLSIKQEIKKSRMGRPKLHIDYDLVAKLRSEGKTSQEIADHLNIHKSTLDKRLRERLPEYEKHFDLEKAKELLKEGHTLQVISEKISIPADLLRLKFAECSVKQGNISNQILSLVENNARFTMPELHRKLIDDGYFVSYKTVQRKVDKLNMDGVIKAVATMGGKDGTQTIIEAVNKKNAETILNENVYDANDESLLSAELAKREQVNKEGDVKYSVDEIHCPHCDSTNIVKQGNRELSSGMVRQRYGCMDCGKRFVIDPMKSRFDQVEDEVKSFVARMRKEDCSFRKIRRELKSKYGLNVSYETIRRYLGSLASVSQRITDNKEEISNPNPKVNERRAKRRTHLIEKGETDYLKKLEKEDEYVDRHLQEIEFSDDKPKLCPFCMERYIEEPKKEHCDICEAMFNCIKIDEAQGQ